jgi:hypothetical protein
MQVTLFSPCEGVIALANIGFQSFCAAKNIGPPGKLVYRCGDNEIYEVDGDVDTVCPPCTFVYNLQTRF